MKKLLLLLAFLPVLGCGHKPVYYQKTAFFMDTAWRINFIASEPSKAKNAINQIFKEVARLDALFRLQDPKSEISKINREAADKPVLMSRDMADIIELAVKYSGLTDGIFDITVGPVVKLWGFGENKEYVPQENELRESLKFVGYNNIELIKAKEGLFVKFKKKGMSLDLGGIAKGYSIDRVVEILKKNGIENALLDAGGQIGTLGVNINGEPWNIGIQNPVEQKKVLVTIVSNNKTFATSSGNKRYFEKNGEKYHHILDPRTGMPANTSISATVILDEKYSGREQTVSDILSKPVFILGPVKGIEFAEKMGINALVVTKENGKLKVAVTKGLKLP